MATCTITQAEPSSSKGAIELKELSRDAIRTSEEGRTLGESIDDADGSNASNASNIRDDDEVPIDAVEALQKWNEPRINMWRVLATFFSFFVFGMNDGAYGALIPYLESYYELSSTIVSLVFLSPFVGYTIASTVNNTVHVNLGQRGVSILGPACHVVTYIVFAFHPPYPVLVVMFIIVGFGNGLIDGAWSAWVGTMANGNQSMGILQAFYSLGATVSPLAATSLFSKAGWQWYEFYYIMVGFSVVEFFTSTWAFWAQSGKVYLLENPRSAGADTGRNRQALKNPLTWIFAFFAFAYVGMEVSLGGWIVSFMMKVRSASSFRAGASSTGFWAGMTFGRLVLPFVTNYLGEFKAVIIYLSITTALELIFWLVPNFIVSAISVALLGLFLGPLIPTALVWMTKLLPRDLHVGGIGFVTAFGGSGGAVFPFIVGVVAQHKGVKTLQPIIVALIGVQAILWFCVPRGGKKDREEGQDINEPSVVRRQFRRLKSVIKS